MPELATEKGTPFLGNFSAIDDSDKFTAMLDYFFEGLFFYVQKLPFSRVAF
jgi:hypothetical protein